VLSSEGLRLSEFSEAIRESTLKRLNAVPEGKENWRPLPDTMSFANLAQHLIDCDKWLFEKLKNPGLQSIRGKPGIIQVESRGEYRQIIAALTRVGEMRAHLIKHLDEKDFSKLIFDNRAVGQVKVWWLIVRGNFDHEIHHRGQIAAYLKFISLSE